MIDREVLNEYNDLCMQVEETQKQLNRLIERQKEVLRDSVKGSNPNFPYEPITFHIVGIADKVTNDDIEKMKKILTQRQTAAKDKRLEVEAWVNTIPVRMQRIVRLKYFEGMTWTDVALRLGGRVSGDAIRMEFSCFMKKETDN